MSSRTPPPIVAGARRLCPACARRWSGLVDPQCPVCAGSGVLVVTRGATGQYGAEAASLAVEVALEGQARWSAFRAPGDYRAGCRALTAGVRHMQGNGLLSREQPRPPAGADLEWTPAPDRPQAAADSPGFRLGFFAAERRAWDEAAPASRRSEPTEPGRTLF